MKISDALLQKEIGFNPHPSQQAILQVAGQKRDITICAGVRFGKSLLCAYEAFKYLLADNQHVWIVSLTYDMAGIIFDYVLDFAAKYDKRLLKHASTRIPQRIEVKEWGSWIECKSADNETSLMGDELDLAILDEAARMRPEIDQRFIQARLTTRKGKNFAISTPFGQNWFHQRYLRTKEADDGASFHFTSKDNPYFPEGEWERAQKTLPRNIFQQEYEALFLADAASVFRNIDNCIDANCYEEPRIGHRYSLGLDLAKFNDFSVLTIVDKDTHRVVYWDRFQQLPYTLQKQRILQAARRYGATVVIDAMNVGAAVGDELRAEGLNVWDFKAVGTISKDIDKQGSKEKLVEKISLFLEDNNVRIPPEQVLIDELRSYGYKLTLSGNLVYGAPEGYHDDCVVSLGLALWPIQGKTRSAISRANKSIRPRPKNFQYL